MTTEPAPNDDKRLATSLFNQVWTLLEQDDRTAADDDRMLHEAHASRYHWGEVGTISNIVIGEWQCSRVYATLCRSEPAMQHANRALAVPIADAEDRELLLGDLETIPGLARFW